MCVSLSVDTGAIHARRNILIIHVTMNYLLAGHQLFKPGDLKFFAGLIFVSDCKKKNSLPLPFPRGSTDTAAFWQLLHSILSTCKSWIASKLAALLWGRDLCVPLTAYFSFFIISVPSILLTLCHFLFIRASGER